MKSRMMLKAVRWGLIGALFVGQADASYIGNIGTPLSISQILCNTTTGLTSGSFTAIGTLALTAGTWNLYGAGGVDLNTGATTQCTTVGISSSNSGFVPNAQAPGSANNCFGFGNSGNTILSGVVVLPNVTVTATTNYYLLLQSTFTGSTAGYCGSFWATPVP